MPHSLHEEIANDSRYRQYYESKTLRQWELYTPRERHRIDRTIERFPSDVGSVLEAGCGDGRMLAAVGPELFSVGVELTFNALSQFRTDRPRLQADIQLLPFGDQSFDLVYCAEVLEHLPGPMLTRCVAELLRVSRRYLLFTVPNQEDLRDNTAHCSRCEHTFHRWGHVNSFSRRSLVRLLTPSATLVSCWTMADPEPYYPPGLLSLRARVANGAGITLNGDPCPSCGHLLTPPKSAWRSGLTRACDAVSWRVARHFCRRPYWLGALFRKSERIERSEVGAL